MHEHFLNARWIFYLVQKNIYVYTYENSVTFSQYFFIIWQHILKSVNQTLYFLQKYIKYTEVNKPLAQLAALWAFVPLFSVLALIRALH